MNDISSCQVFSNGKTLSKVFVAVKSDGRWSWLSLSGALFYLPVCNLCDPTDLYNLEMEAVLYDDYFITLAATPHQAHKAFFRHLSHK